MLERGRKIIVTFWTTTGYIVKEMQAFIVSQNFCPILNLSEERTES
jgi:hypothetical protein